MPRSLLAVALLAAVVGCGKPLPPTDSAVPQQAAVGPPVTEQEAKEFGTKLEAAVVAGDEATFGTLFPVLDMLKSSVSDLSLPPLPADKLEQMKAQFSEQVMGPAKNGGSYKLLRVRAVDGKPYALFRLQNTDGLNYHDMPLTRTADGRVVAEDAFLMLTGEPLRQTLRRLLIQAMSSAQRKKLAGKDKAYAEHMPEILTFTQNVRNKQTAAALATFHKWPEELRKEKMLQLMAVVAASEENEATYATELEAYRKTFPNDPGCDLVSLDYFVIKKQYAEAVAALDRLKAAVGGDSYLDALRGNMFSEMGKMKEAKEAVEHAIQEEPTLAGPYQIRLGIALKEKNNADTLKWLKAMVEKGGLEVDLEVIRTDADYAAFAKSPQFPEFKKWYDARGK